MIDCVVYKKVAIIGSSGGIGSAISDLLARDPNCSILHLFTSSDNNRTEEKVNTYQIDYFNEETIEHSCTQLGEIKYDLIIVATGILSQPEKSLKEINLNTFHQTFYANTFLPALLMKYFLPKLAKSGTFAVLSARVGSISDNKLGGWYAYRSSKSALNMLLKCASIEMHRLAPEAIIVGLHPGTVDTKLSKQFQKRVPNGKLFTPKYSATCLLKVLSSLQPGDSGKVFAYDNKEIEP